jgi:glycosyltransferase involved in cell wall biosynthesis
MKIAIVSCYDQIDYIRARVLRAGFAAVPGVQTVVIKNKHKGLLRYFEVPYNIVKARFSVRPDAWAITFRGYEMLPFLLLVKGRKPLIFDEMLNAAEYLNEHSVLKHDTFLDKLFRGWYGWLLRRCRFVLADTDAHAEYSAKLCRVDRAKFRTIPISTDESVFYPRPKAGKADAKTFNVFYYGVMRRLHGLEYVLEAAVKLAANPHITFTIGGDKGESQAACQAAVARGARITYMPWVPFGDIPVIASTAGLNLGGPFGKTLQSQFVITTKTFQFLALEAPVLIGENKVQEGFINKKNCLIVPPNSAGAIADAITWAYEHPAGLKKIAVAGHSLYQQHFSQKHINARLSELVREL